MITVAISTGSDRVKSFVRQTAGSQHGNGRIINVVQAQVDDEPVARSEKHGIRQDIPIEHSRQDRTEWPQATRELAWR